MLCSRIGIAKLIGLGYVALVNLYYKAWSNKIPQDKRLLLHEALVISVIMYDSSCWAALKPVLEKLDVVHRCHLRNTLNHRDQNIISRDKFLSTNMRCNVKPLSARVDVNRWRMLAHLLRGPTEGPTSCSLVFAMVYSAIPRASQETAKSN